MVPSMAAKPPSYSSCALEYVTKSRVVTKYRRWSARPFDVTCASESVAGKRPGIDVAQAMTNCRVASS